MIWLKYLFKLTELNILNVIVSSLTGPLIMVVMIALLQVPINIVSSIFFAVLVGLTGDNGIHYMFASKDKKGIDSGMSEKAVPSFVFSIFYKSNRFLKSATEALNDGLFQSIQ